MVKVKISYKDIVENEKVLIDFLAKNSDSFSALALIKKPYSQGPPAFNFSDKFTHFLKNGLRIKKIGLQISQIHVNTK